MGKRIDNKNYLQFGYYTGAHLTEVPGSYLRWIAKDMENDTEGDNDMICAAQNELDRRSRVVEDLKTDPA